MQLRQNLSHAATVTKKVAEVNGGSKVAFCNLSLVETHLGMERMQQHSCGNLLPAAHVPLDQECLGMDAHMASAR